MINKIKNPNANNLRGFTLVEVLVAVALFVTILTLATGALFSAQAVNARLQANQVILDGMSLSFETITRDIRYGSLFNCSNVVDIENSLKRKGCNFDLTGAGPGQVLVFKPLNSADPDDRIAYYSSSSKIYRQAYVSNVLEEPVPVTSDEVIVDTFNFYVTGANTTAQAIDNGNITNENSNASDTLQTVINVITTGRTNIRQSGSQTVDFQLQSVVAPRGMDN
jgi:prepilin-type N-terminal cleavage/methylation domain-containing protein